MFRTGSPPIGTRLLLLAASLLGGGFWFLRPPPEPAPGVLVADPPHQRAIAGAPIEHQGFQLRPRARFAVTGRVLGRRDYRSGRSAELAPVDLALGWGPMSDTTVLREIDISQSNRFYYWRVERFPIPRRQIETNSANMHLIPADDRVAAVLRQTRTHELVALEGTLVDASAPDGWRWRTSLTRSDTGRGACELLYVTRARRLPRPGA